jgi:hypothetical protein
MALSAIVLISTACVFTIIQLLSKLRIVKDFIVVVAGIASVVTAPAWLLWQSIGYHLLVFVAGKSGSTLPRWLALEPLVAVNWIILQGVAKQRPTFSSSIAFATLHYGLWSWFFWPGPYESALPLIVPAVGLLSYIVWTRDLPPRRSSPQDILQKA